jgi:ABC-2 type transport system ATP-binding protein
VIAEGTPGQLKASVGQSTLHVRLTDPADRPAAREALERGLGGEVHLESDPAALSVPVADAGRAATAVADLGAGGIEVEGFSLGQPSLDEVFLALTGEAPTEEEMAA